MAHDSAGMVVKLVVSLVRHAPTCGMAHEVDGRAARSGIVRVVASRPQFRLCLVYLSFNTIQKMLPLDSTKKSLPVRVIHHQVQSKFVCLVCF